MIPGCVKEIIDELAEVSASLNLVEIVTPINAATEKEKWLELARKGEFTSPNFRYNADLLDFVCKKTDVVLSHNPISVALSRKPSPEEEMVMELVKARYAEVNNTIIFATYLDRLNAGEYPKISFNLPYQPLNTGLVQAISENWEAWYQKVEPKRNNTLLSEAEQGRLKETKVDAETTRRYFRMMVEAYGFEQSRPIVVSATATAIDVRDKSSDGPIIVIPEKATRTAFHLLELLAHEIEGHWRDSENAQRILPKIGGGALKADDETLYEGHAMSLEKQAGEMLDGTVGAMPKPWYTLAINLATQHYSFADIARTLLPRVQTLVGSHDQALKTVWTTCLRVFRGCCNTDGTSGYVFTKDQAYLNGKLLSQELSNAALENLLEFSTLSIADLKALSRVFKFDSKSVAYPRRPEVLPEICRTLLAEVTW